MIFQFSRLWPSAILDLWGKYLDNPLSVVGSLYHCVKFGWSQCSSTANIESFNILHIWLENAYLCPKIRGLSHEWAAVSRSQKALMVYGCENILLN